MPESLYARNFIATDMDWKDSRFQTLFRNDLQILDVTRNLSVVSLSPFTIAIGFSDTETKAQPQIRSQIEFRDLSQSTKSLGVIHLQHTQTISMPQLTIKFFEILASQNYCAWFVHELLLEVFEWRARRAIRNPFNFRMTRRDAKAIMVIYTCPRPVYLISVADDNGLQLFPMDLVGSLNGYFLMGLRLTSPAVPAMQRSKKIAISSIPYDRCKLAYELGKHHKNEKIDLTKLGIQLNSSLIFKLPVPSFAIDVREVEVLSTMTIGSHCCFITKPIKDQSMGASQHPLSHIQLFYYGFLKRRAVTGYQYQ